MSKAIFFLFLTLLVSSALSAQRVLLLEKSGKDKAQRLMEGDALNFRMKGDNFWQTGKITELRPDIQAIVMNERFILIDEVESIRLSGSRFLSFAGAALMTFGVTWSAYALIGYSTDGDPSTSYSSYDLSISATSIGSGFILTKLFSRKKMRLNDKNRLRIIDLSF